jgi:hypothetical protein
MELNELDCPAYLLSHGCYERSNIWGMKHADSYRELSCVLFTSYTCLIFPLEISWSISLLSSSFFSSCFEYFNIVYNPKRKLNVLKKNKFPGVVNYLANENPPNKTKTHGREIRVCIIKKPPIVNQSICCAEYLNWAGHITPFAACQVGKTSKITLRDIIVCVKPNSFVAELKKGKKVKCVRKRRTDRWCSTLYAAVLCVWAY